MATNQDQPGENLLDYAKGIGFCVAGIYVVWILICIGLVISGLINKGV